MTIRDIRQTTRGPLRDSVIQSMGKEDYIPFRLCTDVHGCRLTLDLVECALYSGIAVLILGNQHLLMASILFRRTLCLMHCIICISPLSIFLEVRIMLIACRWVTDLVEHSGRRLFLGTGLHCRNVFWRSFSYSSPGQLAVAVATVSPVWRSQRPFSVENSSGGHGAASLL